MEGLSPAARSIIESFSSIELLRDYYLIGGTSLALQINHRLSEDLDFCQWIPRYHVDYAIPVEEIRKELELRFPYVYEDRLSFHQVNYLVNDPPVKITFYQTTLTKPDFIPVPLIGNIFMADLNVLGGSKMFVITQRHALRDYYDLFVLERGGHLTVSAMVDVARVISKRITPPMLVEIFNGFAFDGSRFKLSDLYKLEPRYVINPFDYEEFCHDVAEQISALYPQIAEAPAVLHPSRTKAQLRGKIKNADSFLVKLVNSSVAKFGLTREDIDQMIIVGPYTADIGPAHLDQMDEHHLGDILALRSGAIRNLIYNLRNRYSISGKDFKHFELT
jgi:hypothetical protein